MAVWRVNLHDYSGHPFQVQLSRELARRGHRITHQYSGQYVTGRGRLEVQPDDPTTLNIKRLDVERPLKSYDAWARLRFESAYARAWQRDVGQNSYDVVIACNVPLFALHRARQYFGKIRQPWILWHQDVYSLAVAAEARRRLPPRVSGPMSEWLQSVERAQVRAADAVVAIGPGFVDQYRSWQLDTQHVRLVPNWAPIDEIVPGERDNPWSRAQRLPGDALRLLYAGTLGRKHNPRLLLNLLDAVQARGLPADLTVVSGSVGADDLARAAAGRPDVRILPFQPAAAFPQVLASADVVVALLEPEAARFSIPSKVLSYMAAGRPCVALVPEQNSCIEDVLQAGGHVAEPDVVGVADAAEWIASRFRAGEFVELGLRSRAFAERKFNIGTVADQFEETMAKVIDGRSRAVRTAAADKLRQDKAPAFRYTSLVDRVGASRAAESTRPR